MIGDMLFVAAIVLALTLWVAYTIWKEKRNAAHRDRPGDEKRM